jgi:hypothetical protein
LSHNPFSGQRHGVNVNQGSAQVEEARAIAQQQASYIIAASRPRDMAKCYAEIITSCKRKKLAENAIYAFPRAGATVSGPSIRLAEEIARCWGNLDYGIIELSQGAGFSEMMAYAIDLETNTRRSTTFVVKHERGTRAGMQVLTDPRDVYEINANMGARRLRAMLLSIIPSDVVDDAVAQCLATQKGPEDVPLEDRIKKLVSAFKDIGVSAARIEARIGRPVGTMTQDEVVEFRNIMRSIKSDVAKTEDFFPLEGAASIPQEQAKGGDRLKKAAEATATEGKEKKPKKEQAPATPDAEAAPIQPKGEDDSNPLAGAGEEEDEWA